jgi:hypothetical protein
MVSCPPWGEIIPIAEEHCGNRELILWLAKAMTSGNCHPSTGVCCQAGLRTTSLESHVISPAPFLPQARKLLVFESSETGRQNALVQSRIQCSVFSSRYPMHFGVGRTLTLGHLLPLVAQTRALWGSDNLPSPQGAKLLAVRSGFQSTKKGSF